MDRQKILASVKQSYMLKRIRAQEKCEEFISNLRENKEFDSLYTNYTKTNLEYLRSKYDEENEQLKQQVEELKNQIDKYLYKNQIDKNNLLPQYECEVCNDTGVANGKMCFCLLNELNHKLSMNGCCQSEFKSFKDCNNSIMNNEDVKTCNWLKTWCNKYPNISKTNINIIGGAGSGKTFLLECVANELVNKNVVIKYKTAFEINEIARLYHIGKSYEFTDCLNVDVLFIDDLGTEPIFKNVTKEYLYNLINIRQINNKPTFITTNLSMDNILSRYDDRIFSRLGNKNLAITIQLTSEDKRLKTGN